MESLSGRVIRGGLWMLAMQLTGYLFGAARLLILARLLTPHDFGLVGISLVVLSFGEIIPKTFAQNNPERLIPLTRILYPISVVMKLYPLLNLKKIQNGLYRRMLDLPDRLYAFNKRIDNPVFMLKKGR